MKTEEISEGAVAAAKLYGDLYQQAIKSITHTISSPEQNEIHFSGLVLSHNMGATTTSPYSTLWYKISMNINGNEIPLEGEITNDEMKIPEQLAVKILNHVFDNVKRKLGDACIPIVQKTLNIKD